MTMFGELKNRIGKKILVGFAKDHVRIGILKEVMEDHIELSVSDYQETDLMLIRMDSIVYFYEVKRP